MAENRKPGAQPGNANAKRVQRGRIVLSLKEAEFGAYVTEFFAQRGHEPDEDDLKNALKAYLRRVEMLHLYVNVMRKDARKVRELIEHIFGKVRAISLRDSWHIDDDRGERTIYCQRVLKMSEVLDPAAMEPWEIDELKKDDLSHNDIQAKANELRASPLVFGVDWEISTSQLPEKW